MMTIERFEDLAGAYGGEIARWPEGEREAARALLAAQPERLGAVLAQAADLDRLLDLAPAQRPNAALLGRLIAAAPQPANRARRWIAGLGAALGLSAAAFAGVMVGVSIGGDVQPETPGVAQADMVTAVDATADLQDAFEEPTAL